MKRVGPSPRALPKTGKVGSPVAPKLPLTKTVKLPASKLGRE